MLKRFLDGLVFGTGMAVALVAVWSLSMYFAIPWLMTPTTTETKVTKFDNPIDAQVLKPDASLSESTREFSFFKHSESRMQIPQGGGILAMAPMSTPPGATRPSTYQLWLTEAGLWQIRTAEDKAQVEKLSRPDNATVRDIDRLMREKLGPMALQSTMTVPNVEIQKLQSSGNSWRDDSLNGKLSITVDGVVFVLPNAYGT